MHSTQCQVAPVTIPVIVTALPELVKLARCFPDPAGNALQGYFEGAGQLKDRRQPVPGQVA